MGIVYLNNDDYYRLIVKSKETKIPLSQLVKEELHKPPETKEVIKEVPKEVIKEVKIPVFHYWEKIGTDKKERWHEYERLEDGTMKLIK